MIDMKNIVFPALFLVAACTSEMINFGEGTGGQAGTGGAGGMAGVAGGAAVDAGGEVEASDPCGPLMLLSGSVCVDKRPALHADGSQGTATSWDEAKMLCAARGTRLCSESERETSCPGGQEPAAGLNAEFCTGPSSTWEWSTSSACAEGRCVSPCCNATTFPCQCSEEPTKAHSFRCCKDL